MYLWLSPVFTCITQNIKWILSHALVYSLMVLKYNSFRNKKGFSDGIPFFDSKT